MPGLGLQAFAGDFRAELVGLLLVAELPFNVVGQHMGGVPIVTGDFLHDRAMDRIVILFAERHRLGPVAEQLLLAHQVHQDRHPLQAIAQRRHELGLMPKVVLASGDKIQGDGEGHENCDQAEITGGEEARRPWRRMPGTSSLVSVPTTTAPANWTSPIPSAARTSTTSSGMSRPMAPIPWATPTTVKPVASPLCCQPGARNSSTASSRTARPNGCLTRFRMLKATPVF